MSESSFNKSEQNNENQNENLNEHEHTTQAEYITQLSSCFEVWIRLKPFKKYEFSKKLSETQRVEQLGRPLWESCVNIKAQRNKLTNKEIEMRNNDYRALFTSSGEILFKNPQISLNASNKNHQTKVRLPIQFPNLYGDKTSNKHIYEGTLTQKVKDCLDGKSFTLLTYGISGSGKTHTIFGFNIDQSTNETKGYNSDFSKLNGKSGEDQGLIYLAINQLFNQKKVLIDENPSSEVQIFINLLEIYNENVRDLLDTENLSENHKHKKLSIVESMFSDGVVVPEVTNIEVQNEEHMWNLLKIAQERRIVSPNLNNVVSSRSHVIIEIQLQITKHKSKSEASADIEDQQDHSTSVKSVVKSKLRFVDLAGSEKINLETKEIVQEGANINKSLLALTNCVNIMSGQSTKSDQINNQFIPYRNSKLTRLLKDSLSGNTPVILIVCLSPNSVYLEESINSINYAIKAAKIKKTSSDQSSKFWTKNRLGITTLKSCKQQDLNPYDLYQKRIEDLELENRILKTKRNHNPNYQLLSQRSKETPENNLSMIKQNKGNEVFITLNTERTQSEIEALAHLDHMALDSQQTRQPQNPEGIKKEFSYPVQSDRRTNAVHKRRSNYVVLTTDEYEHSEQL